MSQGEEQGRLLGEIRDLLAAQLEEYRRVTGESLEMQRRAVARQEQLGRLYKRALVACALLVVALIWFLSRIPLPPRQ
jgi:hypothetical protein